MKTTHTSALEAPLHFHPAGLLVALVGNPNCGKTALFNALTGSTQKVANYAGATVERKEGWLIQPKTDQSTASPPIRILDLPGTYSLYPRSPDERVTCNVLRGTAVGEKRPDVLACVVDATNLRQSLRLVLSVKRLAERSSTPCVVVLNMMDVAAKRGLHIDVAALSAALGLEVIPAIAIQSAGVDALKHYLIQQARSTNTAPTALSSTTSIETDQAEPLQADHVTVQNILRDLRLEAIVPDALSDRLDRWLLHPILGYVILTTLLFFMFQAVFSWAQTPMDLIENTSTQLGAWLSGHLPDGWIRSLLVDGIIAGLGGVLVFLPQILILFLFILVLEESGYLPRAAFLLDRLMGSVGLSGRSFIPLLSSFACAIPGIMATRTIANPRDRWVTILIAPLMTCSARLPVYALLIAAFIPAKTLFLGSTSLGIVLGIGLQGLVLFVLYLAGIVAAMSVAWVLKHWTNHQGASAPLMMELPSYHIPRVRNIALGLWQRAVIFLRRVGGVILGLTVLLWFLASYPAPPVGLEAQAIEHSFAGMLGKWLSVIFEPIGFNWQMCIALIPGLAAREVAVSALATVYAISNTGSGVDQALGSIIAHSWSLATALSFMAWYVFAPQCLATIAVIKRETNGWHTPIIVMTYLFVLAYLASWLTYHVALWLG
jgi:ferrous iron transport protein B